MALVARLLLPLAGLTLLGAAPEDRCTSLKMLAPAGVTIETAETILEHFTAADGTRIDSAPACRVRGVARPVAGSHIVFELAPDSLIAVRYREDDPRFGIARRVTLRPLDPLD